MRISSIELNITYNKTIERTLIENKITYLEINSLNYETLASQTTFTHNIKVLKDFLCWWNPEPRFIDK